VPAMTEPNVSPVELARDLIRCPSVTPEDAGALKVLERVLSKAGFQCRRFTFTEDGTSPVDNLFARIGVGSPHLCFAGHSDVVPPGDEGRWTYPPFAGVVAEGSLYGRGAADMKGAIACFAAAAIDFAKAKGDDIPGAISLLITGDEEGPAINGTRKVLEWMVANGEQPDHALVGEPTNPARLGQAIKIGRRGSLNGHIRVTGQQGHVAYPHLARNPLKGLIAMLARLYDQPFDFGSAYFSPSNFEVTSIDVGNPTTNIIPVMAEARFNVRYNDRHTGEALQAKIEELAAKFLAPAGLDYELTFEPPSEAFLTEPGQLDSILTQAVVEVTGVTPSLSTDGGTSDARFLKACCPVVEFGLVTETIHKIDEHVSVADLEQLTAVYRRFLDLYFEEFGIFELV
jgi:succinyl-diaminopimelate desuccinylase